MHAILPILLLTALQVADLPQVEAKTLPRVPGPLSLETPDPAGRSRELDARIRHQARRVPPEAKVVAPKDVVILDLIPDVSGRTAYRVEVPPGTAAHARLRADHEAWFRMTAVNRHGHLEPGLLKNRMYTGNPEAFCSNQGKGPMTVFFIVDSTERSIQNEPFQVTFTFKPL